MCDGTGKVSEHRKCVNYGKVMRGAKCECGATNKHSHSYIDTGNIIDCNHCEGTGQLMQNSCSTIDFLPYLKNIDIKVVNGNRPLNINEELYGFGQLSGCTDYGRHTKLTDEQLSVEAMKFNNTVQICKVARLISEGTFLVCDSIVITRLYNGYNVQCVWTDGLDAKGKDTNYNQLVNQLASIYL